MNRANTYSSAFMRQPIASTGTPQVSTDKAPRAGRRRAATNASPDPDAAKPRKSIQSVETGIRVIEALITMPSGRAPLRDIASAAEMSRSQAHRYLLAFINTGLVAQEAQSGLYSLGPTALKIGLSAVSRLDVVQQAASELRNLVEAVGCTGYLCIWGDYGPTIVRWIDGDRRMVTSLNIGSVLPLQTSTAGIIFLAFQAPAKVKYLLEKERARGDGLSRAELSGLIAQARKDSYATTDGQVVPGLVAISAPVFDMQGWPAATMGILGRSTDSGFLTPTNTTAILDAAAKASVAIGWQPDEGPAIVKSASADFVDTLTPKPVRNSRKKG